MTDATGAEGAAEGAAEGQENPAPVDGEQQPPEGEKKGNVEAAKYRTQLRTAEAMITEHQAHIAELQEHVVASMIADRVADPKVFGKLVDREAWAGEDGRIDVAKLDAAVAQLLADHPALKTGKPTPRTRPKAGEGESTGRAIDHQKPNALDRAFPKSGATMQNLLERRPESGSVGDTIRERGKDRRIRGRIGGEDD